METGRIKELLCQCIRQIMAGRIGEYIENPAIKFNYDAKAGKYDHLSDEEYYELRDECEDVSDLWNKRMNQTIGNLLLGMLGKMDIPEDQIDRVAAQFAEWYIPSEPRTRDAWSEDSGFAPDLGGDGEDGPASALLASLFSTASEAAAPAKIRDAIAGCVIGQPDAVKAAAMITFNHLAGRRTNAVFCGPSGCGKSEIWRSLEGMYPGLVRIVDFSRFSAEGWNGSLHLRNIFDGVDPSDLRRRGLIVVLDEADKVLCERAISASGTDYNSIIQNSLLKMRDRINLSVFSIFQWNSHIHICNCAYSYSTGNFCNQGHLRTFLCDCPVVSNIAYTNYSANPKMLDGDVVEFGSKDGQPALSVDCSKVSVVMLGTFERLLEGKAGDAKRIGFGAVPKTETVSHKDIIHGDLIGAGTRLEIAGRIDKIVVLDPLSLDDYKAILRGPVLSRMEKSVGCRISITGAAASALAEQAMSSGLGVRWMKSSLRNAIDDAMFDAPEAEGYQITVHGGKLCCRAQGPRTGCSLEAHAARPAPVA